MKKPKKSRKKIRKKKHFNWHHFIPTSRFKRLIKRGIHIHFEIKKRVVRKVHNAWHILFINMLPHEAIEQVKKWTTGQGMLNKKLGRGKLEAWKIVFGKNSSPREAIEIIKDQWSLPEDILQELLNLLLPKEMIELIKREQEVSKEVY